MNLILSYEASALAAPQSFRDAMQTAANILDSTIQNNITVTIQVGYGDYFNGQISGLGTSAVGGDLYGGFVSYTNIKAALASHETSTLDQTFVNSLPTTSSVNGVSSMYVPSAIEKALGMISPTASAIDGAVGIGTSIPTADLVGVALHEFTHALGREPGAGTFDLGRYTSVGTHLFSSGSTAPAAYFSIDGGVTKLADYGQNSDPSDFLNSGVQGSADPFNEFYSASTSQVLSTVDKQLLDSLGFSINMGTPTGPSAATSSIVASSATVTADGTSATTLTVTVKDASGNVMANTAVTLSASGSANSFGAISGTTNANGVFTTTLASTLAQNETITATEGGVQEQTSVSFVAGAPSAATSSLVASSPTVTADGTSTTTLTVTVHDAHGNAVAGTAVTLSGSGSSNTFGAISGTTNANGVFSTTLASTLVQNETITATEGSVHEQTTVSFVAPVATTVIESFGSTILAVVGSNYFFYPVAGGTGPELKYNGSAVTVGEFGSWTFIGAEQTASGYEVALHVPGSDQYTVWNTNSSGTVVSNGTGGVIVSGTSNVLESLETSFHQDLNGDGVIGVPAGSTTAVIESFGSTILAVVGSNYFFYPVAGGTGPELKYNGSAVTVGEFGSWTFIGAEHTNSGYEVALHVPGSDQYTVWNTDSSGSVVSNGTGGVIVSGTSNVLESLETSFHQDLNGDGVIGVPAGSTTAVIESFGSTILAVVGSNYFFYPVAGGTGPELKYNGSAVTVGEFGSWTFIGAEHTNSGYEVALHVPGSDQYTVWNTDSSGSVVSNGTGGVIVSGTSNVLESLETSFHQDLNGDGVIGIPAATSPGTTTVIESFGSTSLVEVVTNFYLNEFTELKYAGAAVVAGQFGGWAPIGAEQTAAGYEVAWKMTGADQYTVWNTDSIGNYTSNVFGAVSGTSTALESLETSFHQDLNGDGVIGVPAPAATSPIAASPVPTNDAASHLASNDAAGAIFSVGRGGAFVFAPNFGQADIANFVPETDTIQFSKTNFADISALLAAVHNDGHGNAVITDAANDTLVVEHVTAEQLYAHQQNFHIV